MNNTLLSSNALPVGAALTVIILMTGCKGRTEVPTEENDNIVETLLADSTDSVLNEEIVEVIPTRRADELFDDFAFAFMQNRYFQKQRTDFPLPYNVNGEERTINRNEWEYDRMYSQYELYTLIFDSERGERAAKDTTLQRVTVEELDLADRHTRSYDFRRREGEWRLTSLTEGTMGQSVNNDFYEFYHRFATDADYQLRHINDPLNFSTWDDDVFETVEGIISPEQFNDFAPELPTTKITNILYGQSFSNSRTRILSLRALAGGMECTMKFEKGDDGEWMLTRLEN